MSNTVEENIGHLPHRNPLLGHALRGLLISEMFSLLLTKVKPNMIGPLFHYIETRDKKILASKWQWDAQLKWLQVEGVLLCQLPPKGKQILLFNLIEE